MTVGHLLAQDAALVHESSRKWDNYPDLGGPFGPIGHILSMNSRVHPKYKTKYRVSNWAEYDRALVQRGDITLWFSPDAADSWTPGPSGKRGGQRKFSDQAIETALVLRLVFNLPVCSYYSSHCRDQIATLREMAGLHHSSLKAHLICLDFPARRNNFPVPDHREFVAITAERLVNLDPDSLRGA